MKKVAILLLSINFISSQIIGVGTYHSLAVKDNGELYSWGGNEYGQLGLGNSGIQFSPGEISQGFLSENEQFIYVAAKMHNIMAITNEGNLYRWGNASLSNVPLLFNREAINNKKIVKIAAGNSHSILLDEDGRVFFEGPSWPPVFS
ncbi:MAG: hypothetical protein QGH04_09690, partial [Candidatus Marinimicrobia bacterium]|nr:hypothetical protein [Candidatus Neomarinimicrobiota bacterium]